MIQDSERIPAVAAIPPEAPVAEAKSSLPRVATTCLVALSVIAVCCALYVGRAFLLPVATAFVLSALLAPLCSRIEWFRVPRAVSALVAMVMASAVAYGGFALIAEPASRWLEDAPAIIKKAERQVQKLRAPLKPIEDFSKEVDGLSIVPSTTPRSRTVVMEGPHLTQSLISSAQSFAVQTGLVLVLTYFLLLTREDFRQKFIALQPRFNDRVRTARVFRDVEHRVTSYIVTFSIINAGVGVAVGLAAWQLGLPEPAMWGGLASILNFIPFLGPAITMGLLALAGLATFDTLLEASFPVLAYWAINLIESNLVTPTIMGRRMTLNPLAIVLAVSFWTWLWGPVGGLISLPLLVMLKAMCDHTPMLSALGVLIGAPIVRTPTTKAATPEEEPAVQAPYPTSPPQSAPAFAE